MENGPIRAPWRLIPDPCSFSITRDAAWAYDRYPATVSATVLAPRSDMMSV